MTSWIIGYLIILILQMEKLRHEKVGILEQTHVVGE